MENVKSYIEFIEESLKSLPEESLLEALKHELTEDEEIQINLAVDAFVKEYLEKGKTINDLNEELVNEGIIGSIIGGLTGFALGSTIGKIIARVLGVGEGILYDMLTSRLVGAAIGSALGRKV